MAEDLSARLIVLFQKMADLTLPECRSCRVPLSCCDSMYCGCAEEYAREEWGVDLTPLKTDHPTLPFMGEAGCVVDPHLRPLCALHTCDVNSLGFKKKDPGQKWTKEYFKLREEIEELEEIRGIQKGEVR